MRGSGAGASTVGAAESIPVVLHPSSATELLRSRGGAMLRGRAQCPRPSPRPRPARTVADGAAPAARRPLAFASTDAEGTRIREQD